MAGQYRKATGFTSHKTTSLIGKEFTTSRRAKYYKEESVFNDIHF